MTCLFNKKAEFIIKTKIISEHSTVKVKAGKCRWNFRCHNNAVHEAVRNGHEKLTMVIYFDDSCPIIHFINYTNEGEYVDNTLGEWAQRYEYYFVRFIDKDDFWYVHGLHNSYRMHLRNCLPLWVRILSNVTF